MKFFLFVLLIVFHLAATYATHCPDPTTFPTAAQCTAQGKTRQCLTRYIGYWWPCQICTCVDNGCNWNQFQYTTCAHYMYYSLWYGTCTEARGFHKLQYGAYKDCPHCDYCCFPRTDCNGLYCYPGYTLALTEHNGCMNECICQPTP